MTITIHGTVHGKTIECDRDLGIPDGQEVVVVVTPARPSQLLGHGIQKSAGAAADMPEFDVVFAEIDRERKSSQYRESDS